MSGILQQLLGMQQANPMQGAQMGQQPNPLMQQAAAANLTPEEMMRLQQLLGNQTLDLTTGRPATAPPIGSNQVQQPMSMPPMQQQPYRLQGIGTRNEGIYPRLR